MSRRALLAASARAGVGAAGLLLVGCSDDEPEQETQAQDQEQQVEQADQQAEQVAQQQQQSTAQAQSEQQQSQETGASAEPTGPSRGGIIRAWLALERIDSWDPHRSRDRRMQALHSLMYQRLIQPASNHTGELASDLANLPETPDETTYIFGLDPNARFWDREPTNGRPISSHDIVWNFKRQRDALDAAGSFDPSFFRRPAYERTDSAEAPDDATLLLTTWSPDAAYLGSVHASPFAWITSPEAAGLYGDDWRDDPSDVMRNSGTGAYAPHSGDGFEITLARSDHWPRPALGWADGIVLSPGTADTLPSVYQEGGLDIADFPLANETIEALRDEYPEHEAFERPLAAPVELVTPMSLEDESPLNDPRIVRAIALAVDRQTLIDRLYDGRGRVSGPLPWYLDGWSLTGSQLEALPATSSDRAGAMSEIAALVDAAGGGAAIPLVAADLFEGFFPGAAAAVRSMIADATGLEVELEFRDWAVAVDQLRAGERFCLLGWGPAPTQADPTDDWRRTLHSGGGDRWSGSVSADLDVLINQMGDAFDLAERQSLAQEVQTMLLSGEAGQWRVPLVSGVQLGLHQPWLRPDPRLFEYAWSTQYLSNSWVDTSREGYPLERALPELEAELDGSQQ